MERLGKLVDERLEKARRARQNPEDVPGLENDESSQGEHLRNRREKRGIENSEDSGEPESKKSRQAENPQNLRILGRAEGSEDLDHFLANPQHYFADPKFKQELISLVDKYAKKLELGKYAVREDLEFSDEPLDLSMRKRDNEEARPADKPSYSVEELLKIKKR